MRYGLPFPERMDKFRELSLNAQANSINKHPVTTSNGTTYYDVFQVPIELPKYRLNNTRTLALQEQYIYQHDLPEDYFNDIESDEKQEVQHVILKTQINSSDKDRDLLHFFSKHEQTEALILSHEGFVISGNRRLCAFRELLGDNFENFEKFKRFSQVKVVILPFMDPTQIEQIEDYLEQQKDIKDPFSWYTRAIGYRKRMQKNNYSDKVLGHITGINYKEIRTLINTLQVAENYLDFINKPKEYNLINPHKYAFEQTNNCLTKDKNPGSRLAFQKIAFLMIKNKDSIGDRMYKNIPTIHSIRDEIIKEIIDQYPTKIDEIQQQEPSLDPLIPVIRLIEDPTFEEELVDLVTEKVSEKIAVDREKKKKTGVLNRVVKATTLLHEANMIKSTETAKDGVYQQILNAEKEIIHLKSWSEKS